MYGVRAKIIAPIEILDQKKEEEKRKEGNAIGPIVIVADHHSSSDHLDLRCQRKAGYYPYPYQDKRKAG